MKQALPSSLFPGLGTQQPSLDLRGAPGRCHTGKDAEHPPPALLSTTMFKEEPYVLKEMQPTADKIDFMVIRDRYKDMERVMICDMAMPLTALGATVRSSGRQGSALADELIAFGKDHHWQESVLDYAVAYAAKVKKDYQAYFTAYKAGYFCGINLL